MNCSTPMQAQVSAAAANRDQVAGSIDAAQITAAQAQVASAQAQQKVRVGGRQAGGKPVRTARRPTTEV